MLDLAVKLPSNKKSTRWEISQNSKLYKSQSIITPAKRGKSISNIPSFHENIESLEENLMEKKPKHTYYQIK